MKIFLRPTHAKSYEGIEINDIVLLESRSNYTIIHTTASTKTICVTLKEVYHKIKQIDDSNIFFRVNRMSVINRNHVTLIQGNSLFVNKKWHTVSPDQREFILGLFTVL